MVKLTRFAFNIGVALLLTGCGSGSAQPAITALSGVHFRSNIMPPKTKCNTSPPQYQWIFEGVCRKMIVTAAGGSFDLREYRDITLSGTVGPTNAKKRTRFYVVDALDNGDIREYNSQPFPAYVQSRGTTVLYVAVINESRSTVEPVTQYGVPVLKYTVSDYAGLPGNICGLATLATSGTGGQWTGLPGTAQVNGDSVTIDVLEAPIGFGFPSRKPVYFAVSCWAA